MIVFLGGQEHDPATLEMLEQAEELEQQGRLLVMRKGQPFGMLFSKLDAVIGQGGLGVTSEALRAGIPIITSGILLLDQRWWAARVNEMGCGSKAVRIQRLMMRPDLAESPRLIVKLMQKALGLLPANSPKFSGKRFLGGRQPTTDSDDEEDVLEDEGESTTWPEQARSVGSRLREMIAEDPHGVERNVKAVWEAGMSKRAIIVDGYGEKQDTCGFGGAICRQCQCCGRCIWSSLQWFLTIQMPALAFFCIVCLSEFIRCVSCRRCCRKCCKKISKIRGKSGRRASIDADWQDEWFSDDEEAGQLPGDNSSEEGSESSGSESPPPRGSKDSQSTMGRLLRRASLVLG